MLTPNKKYPMALKDQFEQFITTQPRDWVINHDGWESCAIGAFVRHYNHGLDDDEQIGVKYAVTELAIAYGVEGHTFPIKPTSKTPTIMDVLNNSGREFTLKLNGKWAYTARVVIATYGDLQDALAGKLSWVS